MILIFGGAYQGKLDYAKEHFDIDTVCDCSAGMEPDFDADVIYGVEGFVLKCIGEGKDAVRFFRENREKWIDKVMITTDVSQGIVPVDAEMRAFREMNGRVMIYLAGEAESVIRVFCGLGSQEK